MTEQLDVMVPYQASIAQSAMLSFDIVLLINGGILVLVDKVPTAVLKNGKELQQFIMNGFNNVFQLHDKVEEPDSGLDQGQDQNQKI